MKFLVVVFSLLASIPAFAGSSDCTNVTHITSGSVYTASLSDCIISIDKTYWDTDGTLVYLPNNPASGDKFVVVDNQSAEQCDEYGCWHQSISVESVDASIDIYDGYSAFQMDNLGGEFMQNQYSYDGTYYNVTTL